MQVALLDATTPESSLSTKMTKESMQEKLQKVSDLFAELPKKLEPKHALNFFEDVVRKEGSMQQMIGRCFSCGDRVTSTGSYKFHSHLLKCPCLPQKVRESFQALRAITDTKRNGKRELTLLAKEEEELERQRFAARRDDLKQSGIKAGLKFAETHAADVAIADFFYSSAIPFSAVSAPGFHKMVNAIRAAPQGYNPPPVKRLAGELIDTCHTRMWKTITDRDRDGGIAIKFGSAYVADVWDSCDALPLINSAFITAKRWRRVLAVSECFWPYKIC